MRLLPHRQGAASFPSDLGAGRAVQDLLLAVLAFVEPGDSLPLGGSHTEGKSISPGLPLGPLPGSDAYQAGRMPLGCTSMDH